MRFLEVWRDRIKVYSIPLKDGTLRVGRDPTSDVPLAEATVSNNHAQVSVKGDLIEVQDQGSSRGTWMAGEKVSSRRIGTGDELQIGPYRLRVTDAPTETVQGPARDDRAVTFVKFLQDVRQLTELVGLSDLQTVLDRFLERTVEIFKAEKGFVVLAHGDRLSPVLARRGEGGTDDDFSRTVCRRALELGEVVYLAVAADYASLGSASSLDPASSGRVLGVPLKGGDRVLGILYLEGRSLSSPSPAEGASILSDVSHIAGRALLNAMERREIQAERERWRWLATSTADEPDLERTTRSPAMRRQLTILKQAAQEDVTVLILGESGTGKEVVARAIHQASPRRAGPFVAVNCAAIPKDLVEAELFGHEAGAFTGAAQRSRGRLEMSQGGTLFLDELGDLPRDVQAKFLRVLESRTFERLGGRETLRWDARVLAATHRDLPAQIAAGEMRADLYYRLNVVTLDLPPLRERREDMDLLVHELLLTTNRKFRKKLLGVSPDALERLLGYSWPGNIRELRNVIERAFILETSDVLTAESLLLPASAPPAPAAPAAPLAPAGELPKLADFLLEQEKSFISLVLDRSGGNVSRAASALGITRQSLHRKIREMGLRADESG